MFISHIPVKARVLIGIIVVFLIILIIKMAVAQDEFKNVPSQGSGVIAFGDSLVKGVGSSKGNDFVSRLERMTGVPIENAGVSGDTTETALARVEAVLKGKNPKVVIILLGGNDFLRRVPRAQTFNNLKKIIELFQNQGSAVVLLGVQGGILFDGFKNEYEDIAVVTGSILVPNVLDGLIGNSLFMSDSIHPNDKGYDIVARKVLPALKKAMQ